MAPSSLSSASGLGSDRDVAMIDDSIEVLEAHDADCPYHHHQQHLQMDTWTQTLSIDQSDANSLQLSVPAAMGSDSPAMAGITGAAWAAQPWVEAGKEEPNRKRHDGGTDSNKLWKSPRLANAGSHADAHIGQG